MTRTKVYYRSQGTHGQDEDWWFIDQAENGQISIVHEWDYTPLNSRRSNSGEHAYSVEEGLEAAPAEAVGEIKAHLGF